MISLREYIFRVKRTSAGEAAYRIKRMLLAARLKSAALKRRSVVAVPAWKREWVQQFDLPRFEFAPNEHTAVDESFDSGIDGIDIPATLNTPLDSIRAFENACRSLFFTSVNRRYNGIDIRSVWEPARLQHVVRSLLVDEPSQRKAAQAEVLHWIANNPFLIGPHYMSPMECGLRIPVLFYCLKSMTDGELQDQHIIAEAIYRHAWWIYRNLSLYNSLGNHTICECIGLVFGGATFGHTIEGKKWLAQGCRLLDQEIEHQILPDGGPAEQSTAYHRFVLDLYWLAFGFLTANGLYDCKPWGRRLETGEFFLTTFEIDADRYVPIGDNDEGFAVSPGIHPRRTMPPQPADRVRNFDEAGYTVIRGGALVMTFDHGPLGMAPLYNHGHADALSITLTYRGKPALIDPGTYRYNGEPQWRRYFKSTRAHNTVTVDDLDQANQASGFIWTHPFHCKVVDRRESDDGFSIEGSHDGYCRLKNPVRHFRRISYRTPDALHIRDRFTGQGQHTFELNFHLGEAIAIDRVSRWWRMDFDSFFVFLTVIEQPEAGLVYGQADPPLGWNSPAYGEKHPSYVISYRQSGIASSTTFTTAIIINDKQ